MKNRFRYLGRGQSRIWYERGKHLIESMAQYVGKTLPRNCWYFRWELFFWILFLTFPEIIFSNFNSNCSNLLDMIFIRYFKTFSRLLEQFFLTVGQNNFGNKITNQISCFLKNFWQTRAVLLSKAAGKVPTDKFGD